MASAGSSTINAVEGMAPRKMSMRLHLLKGTFLADDGGAAMDPAVWSRMPEDLIWRVVLFLPAVKLFQLQLVSRQWRQVLTSADFRKKFVATATAAAVGAAVERSVIGCVMCGVSVGSDGNGGSRGSKKVKHVDIDLSFVPASFWKSDSYTVKGVADGLVCISNLAGNLSCSEDKDFCMINLLTRTCKMLPEIPFWPWMWQSSGPLTIVTIHEQPGGNMDWMVATCDLGVGAGQGHWTVVGVLERQGRGLEHFAVCAGETYMFCDGRMHVKCAAAKGGSRDTVTFDGPGLLDLDCLGTSSSPYAIDQKHVKLVTHRGSLFLVAHLVQLRPGPDMVCGVWRLVRSRMKWEAVAGLELEEVHRLTGSRYRHAQWHGPVLLHAQGAGDVLCCTLGVMCSDVLADEVRIILGFSLETGTWELLHDQLGHGYEQLLELRPDSFLF